MLQHNIQIDAHMVIHETHLDAAPILLRRQRLDGGEAWMARGDANDAVTLGHRAPGDSSYRARGNLNLAGTLALARSGSLAFWIDTRGVHTGRPAVHHRHDRT